MEYAYVGIGIIGTIGVWTGLNAWLDRTSTGYRQAMSRFDRTVIYPAIAKWFLVRTAGIKAARAARAAADLKRVELVGGKDG